MGFPSAKKINEIRSKLEKAEPSRGLPKNATTSQKIKYKICKKFVEYLIENEMSQVELAREIKLDPARLNEIVKYRIDLFTIDKLIELAEKLDATFKFDVA